MSADIAKKAMDLNEEIHEKNGIKIQGGKIYTKVVHRIEAFRRTVGYDCGIDTTIQALGSGFYCKAVISQGDKIIGSGSAYSESLKKEKSLEKMETTAIGRALASLGLGGDEYASTEEMDTREIRYQERDFFYSLSLCKTEEEITELCKEYKLSGVMEDTVSMRKKGLALGTKFPEAVYGFVDVDEAVEFGTIAKKNIAEGPIEVLEGWMQDNDHKIKALDATLKAKKYNEGGKPSERLFNAYEKRVEDAKKV